MGRDYGALTHLRAGAQNASLNPRQHFEGHFNTEIATGHHHAIGGFDNLDHIGHRFLIFQLGDHFDSVGLVAEQLAQFTNIFSLADKGEGDKVHIQRHAEFDIAAIFFCNSWQIDTNAGQIDVAFAFQQTAIDHFALHDPLFFTQYFKINQAIVHSDNVANTHICN